MSLEALMERLGEPGTLALGALFIGMTFGFMAQRSRFCLRSAACWPAAVPWGPAFRGLRSSR